MSTDIATTLANFQLFSPLSGSERAYLVQHASLKRFAAGDLIIREGEKVSNMFLITQGVVRVTTSGMTQEVVELKRLGAGSYFGEVSVLSGKTATATVHAQEDTETIAIDRAALIEMLQNQPELLKTLEGVTLARAKDTISKVFK